MSGRPSAPLRPPAVEVAAAPDASAGREVLAAERTRRVQALRATLEALMADNGGAPERILELGCGHGHFLTALAGKHPAVQCLGIDFCRDRIRRAERKRQRSARPNLHFIHAEAREFFDALPAHAQFRQVYVLFPDPWPKRRHRKHRLVAGGFLDRVAAVTAIGGGFNFRSDALDYVAEVRALLVAHAHWRLETEPGFPFEEETVFQARAARFDSVRATRVN